MMMMMKKKEELPHNHIGLCRTTSTVTDIVWYQLIPQLLLLLLLLLLFTAIELSPGGSGYFTCIQNIKLVTTEFKSGGLHEKHVVAPWNLGNHLSICL